MTGEPPRQAPLPAPERDAGLQPERTRLAWRRTTLSCAVAASLAARQSLRDGGSGGLVALAAILVVFLAFLTLTHFRIRTLTAVRPRGLRRREALATAGCALALAACAVMIVD
ncbi:DUF202 domain-containing protein [Streptomyces sp. O3]